MLAKFISQQLARPSGLVGRLVLPWLFNRRNAALNDLTLDGLALQPDDRVLEVGFGGGYLLGRMAERVSDGAVAGVDLSPDMVAFCQKRYRALIRAGRLDLRCAPAEALPFPAAHFDKACAVNTIFYWRDVPQALEELARVLVGGGRLALCFTRQACLEGRGFAQKEGVVLYRVGQVEQMMATAGFCPVRLVPGEDRHRRFVCAIGVKRGSDETNT